MKVAGIVGSHRENSNAEFLAREALNEVEKNNCETEIISLCGKRIDPCKECKTCPEDCILADDAAEILKKLKQADGIIVSTPVFFSSVSGQLKNLFDRSVILRRHGFLLRNKVGGAIAVGGSRNGGQEVAMLEILAWMLFHDMIVVGDGKPYGHFGAASWASKIGDAKEDKIGIESARSLGKRISEVLGAIEG